MKKKHWYSGTAGYIYDREYQEYLENKIEVAEAQLTIDLIQEERTIRARLCMQLELIRSRVSMLLNEIIEILNKIPKQCRFQKLFLKKL
jgi:hypothetical protein